MKPVIHFLGDHCKNCIKCVKSCPTEAISIMHGQVMIDDSSCINCHVCVQSCDYKQLKIKDLKLKGSSEVLKKGTKFKNIRLVNGDHNVDCGKIMLKSEFLKKA